MGNSTSSAAPAPARGRLGDREDQLLQVRADVEVTQRRLGRTTVSSCGVAESGYRPCDNARIAVTGGGPGDRRVGSGKSTLARALMLRAVYQGAKVLVIDACPEHAVELSDFIGTPPDDIATQINRKTEAALRAAPGDQDAGGNRSAHTSRRPQLGEGLRRPADQPKQSVRCLD